MVTVPDAAGESPDPGWLGVPRPRDAVTTGTRRARGRRVAQGSTSRALPSTAPSVVVSTVQVVLPPDDVLPAGSPTAPTSAASAAPEPRRDVATEPGGSAATVVSAGTPGAVGADPGGAVVEVLARLRSLLLRRWQLDEAAWWCALAGFGSGFAAVATLMPQMLPLAVGLLLVLIGLVLTPPLYLLMDSAVVGTVVGVAVLLAGHDVEWVTTAELVMVGATVIGCARHRERAGVADKIGPVGEADVVLVDLRDRLQARTAMPALPPGWRVEAELRQARGDRFGGDFVVATQCGQQLDVVLVDVSGKGRQAGGRALLLRGAFAALLDSVPREDFLRLANQHVLRHGDDDGFATAVHLSLELGSGRFTLAGAGHPPAAQHHAGAGRWSLLDTGQGLPLGVQEGELYPVFSGVLRHGDSLLLYTDGLVEADGIDVSRGTDRLLGRAETALMSGPRDSAARIVDAVGGTLDDRGLVVLHRS